MVEISLLGSEGARAGNRPGYPTFYGEKEVKEGWLGARKQAGPWRAGPEREIRSSTQRECRPPTWPGWASQALR